MLKIEGFFNTFREHVAGYNMSTLSPVRIHPSSVCSKRSVLETTNAVVEGFHAYLSTTIDG